MKKLSVHEAKAHFSSVIKGVEEGEVVIITRHDKPVVELRPIADREIPVLGAFSDPSAPHLEVSWSEEELDELLEKP